MSDRVFDQAQRLQIAERQRDEALGFLAHDARAPAATILGMVELARARQDPAVEDGLLRAIEEEARGSLERLGGFVALARAETRELKLEALDLRALLQQAVDRAWLSALTGLAAGSQLAGPRLTGLADEAPILGDRVLLAETFERLFRELTARAAPPTRPGTGLECRLEPDAARGQWSVSLPQPELAGDARAVRSLPLRLLQVAVQRHGGSLRLLPSTTAQAAALTIELPQLE